MTWYSILPPLIAILVVFWRKEVILALVLALLSSELLLALQGDASNIFMGWDESKDRFVLGLTDNSAGSVGPLDDLTLGNLEIGDLSSTTIHFTNDLYTISLYIPYIPYSISL